MCRKTVETWSKYVGFVLLVLTIIGIVWAKIGVPQVDERIEIKTKPQIEATNKRLEKSEDNIIIIKYMLMDQFPEAYNKACQKVDQLNK